MSQLSLSQDPNETDAEYANRMERTMRNGDHRYSSREQGAAKQILQERNQPLVDETDGFCY